MVQATVGESEFMLDASSKYSAMGHLPIRALNLDGLLVKKDAHQIIPIPINNVVSVKSLAKLDLDTDELVLTGSCSSKLSDYAAVRARIKADKEEEDEDTQDFDEGETSGDDDDDDDSEDEDSEDDDDLEEVDLREDEFEVTMSIGFDDIEQDIKTEYDSKYYGALKRIGDEIFIDAFVIQEFSDNPFEAEKRDFPAFFNSKHDHMYMAMIAKPEGYTISSVPENLTMTMEGGAGTFIYNTSENGEQLSVRCVLKIKKNTFVPQDYDVLRRFFDAVLDKQNEKIVFKKA